MTEEQARGKWCPFYRVHNEPDWGMTLDNRGIPSSDQPKPNCIASECMAWKEGKMSVLSSIFSLTPTFDNGYCGLAGRQK